MPRLALMNKTTSQEELIRIFNTYLLFLIRCITVYLFWIFGLTRPNDYFETAFLYSATSRVSLSVMILYGSPASIIT